MGQSQRSSAELLGDEVRAPRFPHQYLPLSQSTYSIYRRPTGFGLLSPALPWFISFFLLISLIFVTFGLSDNTSKCSNFFWKDSDFGNVQPSPKSYYGFSASDTDEMIEEPATREVNASWKQVMFKANLKYNESHKLYRPTPEGLDYVGLPSPEVDAAWDELIGPVEIFLTHEEEKFVGDDIYFDKATGLHISFVTAHHDLHCLNTIRQYIYKDYYPKLEKDYTTMAHVEHCIDALRETLMCYGDMTLIPVRWSENRGNRMPDYEVVHTCRDYEALRDWSRKRYVH